MNALPPQLLNPQLRGVRFAPSPTGSFHVGNLRTAWISWELARRTGQPWIVRFEDIDQPRVQANAQMRQLEDMRVLGLLPDEVLIQTQAHARHRAVFEQAMSVGQVYPCTCSRKEVQAALGQLASAPHSPNAQEAIYSGHCRELAPSRIQEASISHPHPHPTVAWRFRMEDPSGTRDFIVARTERVSAGADAFAPSYHWACAIDDADGKYALLVRAWDLAPVLEQQRAIQSWLGGATPEVFHTSLVVSDDGSRLEKRTRGVTLAELEESGLSPEEIVRKFASSFRLPESAGNDGLWGEPKKQLKLSELGLLPSSPS
jgi:glutamyl-tRNA synthetase